MSKKKSKRLVWETDFDPVSRDRIEAVELKWGVKFPDAYIVCAEKYHGGFPNLECFDIPGRKECVLANLLSYGGEADIESFYQDINDRLPKMIFPFAEDPFGNAICFNYQDYPNNNPGIIFWDHEAKPKSKRSILPVADSFTEFLRMLYEPE